MKTSFIATTYNEEETINALLNSLEKQSMLPNEVIIVDSESTDNTLQILKEWQKKIEKKIRCRIISKKSTRAAGRNIAIENATGDAILISDAGCKLDNKWAEEIIRPLKNGADAVAGFYKGDPRNEFERAQIPYFLVTEDKLTDEFLPATRSMAIKKDVWKQMSGFKNVLNYSEDFEFAKRLKSENKKISFAKNAVVYWKPKKNIKEFYKSIFNMAKGDIAAKILRPKVLLVFARYIVGMMIIVSFLITQDLYILSLTLSLVILYFLWSVTKNIKHTNNKKEWLYLVVLQLLSDIAVMHATISGYFERKYRNE